MTKAEYQKKQSKKFDFDFESDLKINQYQLDKECLTHPGTYFNYANAMQEAKSDVATLSDELALITAETSTEIREAFAQEGKKTTEALINSEVQKNEKIINASRNLREAQKVLGTLNVAVQAMDTKKSMLDNLVKLYCAGYFSTVDSNGKSKESINEKTSKNIRKGLNNKE